MIPKTFITVHLFSLLLAGTYGFCSIFAADGDVYGKLVPAARTQADNAAKLADARFAHYQDQVRKYEAQERDASSKITELKAKISSAENATPPQNTSEFKRQLREAENKRDEAEKALNDADPDHGKDLGNGLGRDQGGNRTNKGLREKECEAYAAAHKSKETASELQNAHDKVTDKQNAVNSAQAEVERATTDYRNASSDQMAKPENMSRAEAALGDLDVAKQKLDSAKTDLLGSQQELANLAKHFDGTQAGTTVESGTPSFSEQLKTAGIKPTQDYQTANLNGKKMTVFQNAEGTWVAGKDYARGFTDKTAGTTEHMKDLVYIDKGGKEYKWSGGGQLADGSWQHVFKAADADNSTHIWNNGAATRSNPSMVASTKSNSAHFGNIASNFTKYYNTAGQQYSNGYTGNSFGVGVVPHPITGKPLIGYNPQTVAKNVGQVQKTVQTAYTSAYTLLRTLPKPKPSP